MTRRWRAIGLAAALLLATSAFGGESPSAPATNAPEATEPSAEDEPRGEPRREGNAEDESEETLAPEVFTPSEHISEDIAVPFPVDI